jgi:hypothetical protein
LEEAIDLSRDRQILDLDHIERGGEKGSRLSCGWKIKNARGGEKIMFDLCDFTFGDFYWNTTIA